MGDSFVKMKSCVMVSAIRAWNWVSIHLPISVNYGVSALFGETGPALERFIMSCFFTLKRLSSVKSTAFSAVLTALTDALTHRSSSGRFICSS